MGSVSALFNTAIRFFGCGGMALGTLPWSTYITGFNVCIFIAAGIAIVCWILLCATGMKLKGMER